MDELSLYVLDITMNAVRAGATEIFITLTEDSDRLTFTVTDNGCGMTREQVDRLTDPFFTTRKTRKVGLGIPFLTMLAEMTGGSVSVQSVPDSESEKHGTTVCASFGKNHIDFIPLGDMPQTLVTLIQGAPDIRFVFRHDGERGSVTLDTAALKQILGDEISLAEPEILSWIHEYLGEQYAAL